MVGKIDKKTITYKCIAYNVIVAGVVKVDAVPFIADDSITFNGVVGRLTKVDALPVYVPVIDVADIIALNSVIVTIIPQADAGPAVYADIIACNDVIARIP
jgi:hypothetical protein